jgi:hypothetical protein
MWHRVCNSLQPRSFRRSGPMIGPGSNRGHQAVEATHNGAVQIANRQCLRALNTRAAGCVAHCKLLLPTARHIANWPERQQRRSRIPARGAAGSGQVLARFRLARHSVLDDNQRSHGARRPTTASPRRTHASTCLDADARSTALPLRQVQEQRPRRARCLLGARWPAPRASGRPGRRVIEATVSRTGRRSCFRSQPARRTDPPGGCSARKPTVICASQPAQRALAFGQMQRRRSGVGTTGLPAIAFARGALRTARSQWLQRRRPPGRRSATPMPRTRSSAPTNVGDSFPRGAVVCTAAARRLLRR